MSKIIYIDMDNTLCDYSGAKKRMQEIDPELEYPQARSGFFLGLKPYEGAIEGFRMLEKKFEVYILTAPSYKNPACYTEKRLWVEQYFDLETTKKLIICNRKGLLKGDYLIDDYAYPEFEGEQLLYGTAPFESWDKVLKYLM